MDFNSIEISWHALDQFYARKKGKPRKDAEAEMRLLLARSRELLYYKNRSDGSRFFVVDYWCFVIKENQVVTVYDEPQVKEAEYKQKRRILSHKYLRAKKSNFSNKKWKWR